MLCRIAEKYGALCTGVERSAYLCEEAIEKIKNRGLSELVTINQMMGEDFEAADASFDVAMCIGAEWVFGGLQGTLTSLARWTRPGGTVTVGTPFWAAKPPDEYLQGRGMSFEDFSTHDGNVGIGESLGLNLIYAVASSRDEWDHYSSLTWLAAYDFIRDHPDDPDVPEIAELTAKDKIPYFRFGREYLSWAIYVFRKP